MSMEEQQTTNIRVNKRIKKRLRRVKQEEGLSTDNGVIASLLQDRELLHALQQNEEEE